MIVIGLIGFGFYQNEEANRGVSDCRRAVIDANSTIALATQQVQSLDQIADDISGKISDDIQRVVMAHVPNTTIVDKVVEKITHIQTKTKIVRGDIDTVKISELGSLNDALKLAYDIEYFRWVGTILVYCLYVGLLLLMFVGLLIKSKGFLVISIALAIFCSLFIWATTGVYLSFSVVLSDLCEDPDSYFLSLTNGSVNEGAIKAYILCVDTTQPYQTAIQDALNAVSEANKDVNETLKLTLPYNIPELAAPVKDLQDNLAYATGNLSILLTNVGLCGSLHTDYVNALNAGCQDTLLATAFLSLVSLIVGCMCTLIIFTLPCVWTNYGRMRQRAEYLTIDDTDPFLPRPPLYEPDYGTMGRSTPRPWSERGTLQHRQLQWPPMTYQDCTGDLCSFRINQRSWSHRLKQRSLSNCSEYLRCEQSEDTVLMTTRQHPPPPRGDSPPPAYHPGRFNIRQYADTAPSTASVHSNH